MKRFAELLDRLSYEPGRNNKLRLMTDYFRHTPDPDRGYALAALKSSGGRDVPWQRVINRQRRISLAGEGESIQRQLLEAEEVEFDADGRVDLERFGWEGPDLAWLEQNGFNLPF